MKKFKKIIYLHKSNVFFRIVTLHLFCSLVPEHLVSRLQRIAYLGLAWSRAELCQNGTHLSWADCYLAQSCSNR